MTAEVAESEWTPEHEGQQPPFERGNRLAVKHGAFSEREIAPKAKVIFDAIVEDAPAWLQPSDLFAIEAFAVLQARVDALRQWTEQRDTFTTDGNPTGAQQWWAKLERQAERARARIGFDVPTRFGVMKNAAVAAAVSGGLPDPAKGLATLRARSDLVLEVGEQT